MLSADETAAPPPQRRLTIDAAAFLGLAGSLATVAFSIVRSKVVAVRLGPTGIGEIAEINQLVTLANVATVTMTGAVLINHLARARAAGDIGGVRRVVVAAWTGAMALSGLGGLVAVVVGRFVLPLPWGPAAWPLTALAALGSMFGAAASVLNQTLIVHERIDRATLLSVVVNAAQAAVVVTALMFFELEGFFVANALAAALFLPVWMYAASRDVQGLPRRLPLRFDGGYMLEAVRFGGTTLIAGAFAQGLFTLVRWLLEQKGGPALNGQYQAASAVGTQYFAMVLASLGSFAFPRYAAAADPEALAKEIRDTCAFVLRMAPPLVLVGIAGRDIAVRLLYSLRFAASADLLGWQMAGDVAKGVSWAIAGPLLVRGRLRAYLVCEGIGVALHAAASLFFIRHYGLIGEGYAQLLSYVVYVFQAFFIVQASCDVKLSWRPVLLTLPITAATIVAVLASRRWPAARWAIGTAGVLWAERTGLLATIWRGVQGKVRRMLGRVA